MGKLLNTFMYLAFLIMSHSSLAQDSSRLKVHGLHGPVEVMRDKWGVNHIYARDQHDLFFAQGYCAAKDRLFQFEIWRRQATGTVAEILGTRELKRDIGTRLFKFRGNMNQELNHYHANGKAIIMAFTEGVNAFIDQTRKTPSLLPVEFRLLKIVPGKWTPEVVISRHQGILGNATEELNIGRAVSIAGEKKVKELLWFHPDDPLIQLDSLINGPLLGSNILELYNAFRKDITFELNDVDSSERLPAIENSNERVAYQYSQPFKDDPEGSNNWVISAERSSGKHTMLASDPHRKIALPSLRYIVHLVAPGWNVEGGGEPEIPGVAIGHNDYGAWGFTVHQTDAEDLYVYELNPDDLSLYRYRGQWIKMKEIDETINVKGTPPVKVSLFYTLHGPVTFIDSLNHKAYAMRAAWLEYGSAPYLSSLRMDQARNWSSFRNACGYSRLPSLNMVWADKKDTIGWQVVGLIPVRRNFSGLVPVTGDGRYEWRGYLPVKERPHVFNPSKGYMATANEDLIPEDFKYRDAMGFTWPDAYRAKRINQVLMEERSMNLEKMKLLQTDYFSFPAKELVPMLQDIKMDSELSAAAAKEILGWNFVMERYSVAAGIYNRWEKELMLLADKRFVPDNIRGLVAIQTTKLISWLKEPDSKFGEDVIKGRNSFLKDAFESAVLKLKAQLGTDISNWQFGQNDYKHIQFIHPLSELLKNSWKRKLNTGSYPRAGYGHTVGATGNQDNQGNGASFRYITNTANWDETLMSNSPGQSGDPASPWYKNLLEAWSRDEYFPAFFSKEKIRQVTAEHVLMMPGK